MNRNLDEVAEKKRIMEQEAAARRMELGIEDDAEATHLKKDSGRKRYARVNI